MPRLVYFELGVKDVEKAIKFYENVFGWKFEEWGGSSGYWEINTGDESERGIDGGLSKGEEGLPSVVNTILVENADEVIKKIKSNGGEIVRPKHALPGVGWVATFKDAEGIVSGIMQEDPTVK